MFPEDERRTERLFPFDQIIEPDMVFENGERKWLGVDVNNRLYGDFRFEMAVPGDAAIIELLYSDPVRRLGLIQQLILPPEFATRPETADFTRLEHSVGCMLLTRKLGGSQEQQIRALLHDVAQTAFSHLGDWLKQGMDGADDHHDQVQLDYLRSFGIDKVLENYGFDFETVLDKEAIDFVERPSPDLCVDRIDYALREFARWTCPDDVVSLLDSLTVRDDMIVFKSQISARVFADNYHKLFWWHWAHDEHAVKETLFFKAVQIGISTGVITEDDMYGVDPALLIKLQMWGDEKIQELLHLASKNDLMFEQHIGTAEGLALDSNHREKDTNHLYFPMRHFRPRAVDPSFINEDDERLPLSWIDGDFRTALSWHIEGSAYEYNKYFLTKFGEELLHQVCLEVEPYTKNVLSGTDEFR